MRLRYLFETEALKKVPFCILGNKIDIPTACSEEELRGYLNIPMGYSQEPGNPATRGDANAPIACFMVSLVHKQGYSAGFKWISDILTQRAKEEKAKPPPKKEERKHHSSSRSHHHSSSSSSRR
jgi:hypothetical protein